MSILTDTDLRRIICTNEAELTDEKLLIQPFEDSCLTPMGYDLRVGCFYKTYVSKPNLMTIREGEQVIIKPRDTYLIGTFEQIRMPKDGSISALILSKVSKVAKGLSQVSTKVDPGWGEGELLIPVQNLSRDSISLDQGEAFCTIVFFKNESLPSSVYSSGSSRLNFVKLLAQANRESLNKDFQLGFISLLVLGSAIAIGYYFFGNSPGFGVTVAAGVAIEKVASGVAARIIGRR
ncbi:deoxycytidine triphosphate deaminase [Cylindrospermum sp. NIES-4074]|nr:deoxycytidine triphosphate deaminase [Cylindrospermum sp. NIES-4074]